MKSENKETYLEASEMNTAANVGAIIGLCVAVGVAFAVTKKAFVGVVLIGMGAILLSHTLGDIIVQKNQ